MPDDIRDELGRRGLTDGYADRPFYQRNDYFVWIGRAKRPETRRLRIDQMLAEPELGAIYMGMNHPPSRRT